MQQHDVMLPIRSPLFTTTTDQLIGSVPAAANPRVPPPNSLRRGGRRPQQRLAGEPVSVDRGAGTVR